jgi:hypothetical protein
MNAASVSGPTKGPDGPQNQLALDGAAPSVSPTLSSPLESVTRLATGLRLTIDLEIKAERQWLNLTLEDDLNLSEAKVIYPILCNTLDRSYHLRESLVIGMRRLMQEALDQKLISDYPGELMTSTHTQESVDPTANFLAEFMPSLTDLESL